MLGCFGSLGHPLAAIVVSYPHASSDWIVCGWQNQHTIHCYAALLTVRVCGGGGVICMTDDQKQALRNSMAGKKVSEMTAQERELFDQEFQYGFKDKPQIKPTDIKAELPSKPQDLTMGFLSRMNLIVRK